MWNPITLVKRVNSELWSDLKWLYTRVRAGLKWTLDRLLPWRVRTMAVEMESHIAALEKASADAIARLLKHEADRDAQIVALTASVADLKAQLAGVVTSDAVNAAMARVDAVTASLTAADPEPVVVAAPVAVPAPAPAAP